jgi:putative flippase GtrA
MDETRRAAEPRRSRFAPFVGVGAIGFIIDASILTLLASFGWSNYAARAVSFPIAITVTWLCNRNWVFTRTDNVRREYGAWVLTQVVGAAINLGGFALLLSLFPRLETVPVVALIGGGILALLFNYFAARRWVFVRGATRDAE